jgi:hypothetical protein
MKKEKVPRKMKKRWKKKIIGNLQRTNNLPEKYKLWWNKYYRWTLQPKG